MQVGNVTISNKLVKIGVLGLVGIIFLNGFFNARSTGITKENRLNSQFQANQAYLDSYIAGFAEQSSVVKASSATLNEILLDAVKGRYDNEKGGFNIGSAFFAAIHEAYPEASLAELQKSWAKLQDYVAAKREGYANLQTKLIDMMREYDTWRSTGKLRLLYTTWMFPSKHLEARIGKTVLTGDAARDKMLELVLTSATRKAYEEGTLEPLTVPSN